MNSVVSNKNETVRLFKNPVLEYFSHIHPATPFVVFVPVVLYFLYHSVVLTGFFTPVLWLGGILFWTLLEYTLHRFAFHHAVKSKLGERVHFLVHGIHHDYPRDATRLVMPLLVSVPLAFLFHSLFATLFTPYNDGLYAGLVSGYLAYDFLHFAFHHFAMNGRIGSWLKVYHLKHHYNDPNSGYGVSNPLWDYVFGTVPRPVAKEDVAGWIKAA